MLRTDARRYFRSGLRQTGALAGRRGAGAQQRHTRRRHALTEDFCILNDEQFFVRSVLRLPVIGSDGQSFGYGVWATLSRKNFEIYIDTLDSGEQQGLGPWFGWFSNRLNGYPETLNLKAQIHAQGGHVRPLIELEPTDHPLAVEQRVGITFDRLLEIYALNGHDMCRSMVD